MKSEWEERLLQPRTYSYKGADPKAGVNRLQRCLHEDVCARLMQLQKLKGRGRIEWHNALQACDLEEMLQVSAAGKAAAMLNLPQKSHSNLYATGK